MPLIKYMVFEARLEKDYALISSGNYNDCYREALNRGFRFEGYVNKGPLLYNPGRDLWATITEETADTIPSSLNAGLRGWYFFEYPKRPNMDDPRRDMLRGF